MPKNKKIDDYIARSQPFAQPILNHLRKLVHAACPDVEEKIKWSFACFDYKDSILCTLASFKQHCSFGFWKAPIMSDSHKIFKSVGETSMGHLGRITSLKDLPSDKILIQYIKEAVKLTDEGVKLPSRPKAIVNKEPELPAYFKKVLNKNKRAVKVFKEFSPSKRREYIEWITEAKTEDTRNRRLSISVKWISEGKTRNWKYIKK
ncbi:MAG: YdeI/OmpD-associated family protein [Bacteroidetes bacterium]|nr:YdeI/OmpD-associated family protein [Bacteroidota bacterium]